MMNLWRELRTGPNAPEIIYTLVEIPKGSRNKYEYNKEFGVIKLDRVLYSSLHYPGDYGLIPQTFYDDGDPLDILVMVNEPTFPGCIIEARPIGIFRMLDKGVADDKILAVPARDPIFTDYHDITDIPKHYLAEVGHFFEVYKDLEGMRTKPIGWENAAAAKTEILRAMKLYQDRFHMGGL
ncbi:MAG: inorganic diphosphatase [Anaerolineae bacterium]|mgnify:CR=1 FL=1|jgi:inorganic pyrophosphatase|uniref:inorganic diphosphatase n=1 Tax=Candidatus Amarolinea dominans TaxID=3140696 RepID=UPI001DAEC3A2|nr:inorganic diphosphatase [Anaerolineae bacterium]MBK7203992.1 inorganic diphosphatase [Anaerolineae bacterium]MBK9092200.1 inorganic diphosphatase [Anaerolineae bacterium]MBK9229511.1 inorganic diphosphatase [Anaerolineae bacterium]